MGKANILNRILQALWKVRGVRDLQRKLNGRVYKSDFEYLPGMTTLEERNYFYEWAKAVKGSGQIVDLGCWLGSTTVPLLKGLAASKAKADIKVYAFDRFIWNKEMEQVAVWLPNAPHLAVGSNFKTELEKNVANYKDRVEIVEADLKSYQWKNGPIELLLVDAMKTRSLTVQIARSFLPGMMPHSGSVIFQDFAHFFTPWIHILTYALRHKLTSLHNVDYSGSMVFTVAEKINVNDLDFLNGLDQYSGDINQVFNYSLSITSEENKPKVIAAKAMWYVYRNNLKEAKRVYEEEIAQKYRKTEDVKSVKEYIDGNKTVIFFEK